MLYLTSEASGSEELSLVRGEWSLRLWLKS
jgi:hypothetical protein